MMFALISSSRTISLFLRALLPSIKAAEIVKCMRKSVDGISQNLQGLSPY